MEMFREQFKALETPTLVEMFTSLSQTISALRDKPFCTIRQMEELENELNLNRITFQMVYEELLTRQLTEEEQLNIQNQVKNC